MKRMWKLGRSKPQRTESSRALIETNNNDTQDGNNQAANGYCSPLAQNTFNTLEEQCLQRAEDITREGLAELLGVAHDANTSETNSKQQSLRLIQRSVSQHFPKPPADLDENLQQHLFHVQETVCNGLVRLCPLLESMGLMGCLIDCYHHQTFDHLNNLLENSRSSQNTLVLMMWVLHTYLSQELLSRPDLREMDLIKKVDLLLVTEWVAKATDKLLEHVQREVRESLENILQMERRQDGCNHDHEEAFVGLYVDTIQCIDAMPKKVQEISSKLSDSIWAVCFQELMTFLERYTAEQTEILEKKAKMNEPATIHFFKTLKTCKELKQHVQMKSKGIKRSLLQEAVAALENMEAFTLKLLMEVVADMAESHLNKYFKSENKQFLFLLLGVQTYLPKLMWCQDIQKRVMDEAYKLIAHTYLKHLIRRSQKKLRKCWSPVVGQTVTEDANLLHNTMSDLAPGVRQWNLMLLKSTEKLECTCIDAEKVTVAVMQKECPTWSEDLDLLPALLRWKGLSGWQVREVLDALPGEQPRPRSVSWCSCIPCC